MARHNKDCEKVLARRGHFTAAFFGQGYNGVRLLSGYWAVPGVALIWLGGPDRI